MLLSDVGVRTVKAQQKRNIRLAVIGAAAAAPLVAGALIPLDAEGHGPTICLMRNIFGLPCPFCGATRAFIEFGHGRSDWISNYNGFWVIVSIAAIVFTAIALLASLRDSKLGERLDRLLASPRLVPLLLLSLSLPGWIWAMTNRSTIV